MHAILYIDLEYLHQEWINNFPSCRQHLHASLDRLMPLFTIPQMIIGRSTKIMLTESNR